MQQQDEIKPKPTLFGFKDPVTGLTHIMTDEDRVARLDFIREFVQDLDPWGRVEIHFARSVALDSWRLNRLRAVEENMFAYGQVPEPPPQRRSTPRPLNPNWLRIAFRTLSVSNQRPSLPKLASYGNADDLRRR